MGNIFTYSPFPKYKKLNRQILSPIYIRRLIDKHFVLTCNYFQFTSLYSITLFLQKEYSDKITIEMVKESLELEPSFKIIYFCGKSGYHYLLRK